MNIRYRKCMEEVMCMNQWFQSFLLKGGGAKIRLPIPELQAKYI